jgi:hypothetical protein
MKLVEAKADQFVFRFSRREREMLVHILRQFPVGSRPVGPVSKQGDPDKLAEREALLAEAMAEQRQQDRHLVDAFLGEQGRFAEVKGGFHLAQMDWLLQVLNEVRVGLWVKAGRPEQPRSMVLGGHLEPALTMELCAHFQMVLLGAFGGVVD